jgi:hypothetical protein
MPPDALVENARHTLQCAARNYVWPAAGRHDHAALLELAAMEYVVANLLKIDAADGDQDPPTPTQCAIRVVVTGMHVVMHRSLLADTDAAS